MVEEDEPADVRSSGEFDRVGDARVPPADALGYSSSLNWQSCKSTSTPSASAWPEIHSGASEASSTPRTGS